MAPSSSSSTKFIAQNRKPRVHISYENPGTGEKEYELPFVMGVMADLSGNSPGVAKPVVDERKFLDTDMDNFDKRMAAIKPGVALKVENKLAEGNGGGKLSMKLTFNKMDDFSPAAIARQVPELAKLLAAREKLEHLRTYMDGKAAAEDALKKLLSDPVLLTAMKSKLKPSPSSSDEQQ